MKKPSLKRKKKQATPQELAAAPAVLKQARRRRKKDPTAQGPGAAPAAPKQSRRKRKKEPTPQELAAPVPSSPANQWRARKRPPARVIAYALLAIVVVLALLQLRGGRDDERLVRRALTRYEQASARKDYQTLCDELLSKSYVRQTASSGLPCEVALRTALADVRNPKLQVLGVKVDGHRATARVRGSAAGQVPGEASYTLVLEDDAWRIRPPRSGSAGGAGP